MKSKILTHAARIAKCILIAATLLAMLPLAARADKSGDADYTPYVKLEKNGVTTPKGDQAYKATYYATDGDVPTEEGIYTLGYNGCRLPYIEGIGSWQITAVEINESFANYHGTNYSYMFNGFENLAQITGIGNIDVTNATDLSYMFFSCKQLRELDLSSFNTEQVINAERMFASCYNLEVIYVGEGWNMNGVGSDQVLFDDNRLLFGGKGTYAGDNKSYVKDYALIDGTNDKHGLLTKTGAPKYELTQDDISLINISNDGEPEINQYQDINMDLIALKFKDRETPLPLKYTTVTGYDKYTSGEQTLKVTFRGKEYEFPITVIKGSTYFFSLADGSRYVDKGTKPEDIKFEVIPSGEPFQIPLTDTKVTYTGEINFNELGDYPITVTYEGKTYDLTITVRNKIKGLNFDNVTCDNLNKHLHELPSGDVTVICENNSDNYTIDFSKMELDMDNYSDGIIAVISYQDYKPEEPIEVKITFDPEAPVPCAIYNSEDKTLTFTLRAYDYAASGNEEVFDLPDPWEEHPYYKWKQTWFDKALDKIGRAHV